MKFDFKKVIKKPIIVEAFEVTKEFISQFSKLTIVGNINKNETMIGYVNNLEVKNEQLIVKTLEGDMKCNIGDFVIKGVRGEFYPCRRDIFLETYNFLSEKELLEV